MLRVWANFSLNAHSPHYGSVEVPKAQNVNTGEKIFSMTNKTNVLITFYRFLWDLLKITKKKQWIAHVQRKEY